MNDRYKEYIDQVIKDVNNISDEQLSTIGLQYMKCKRVNKYLIMLSKFDADFSTRMYEITTRLNEINLPMKVFKCGVVLIINLEKNKYVTHRLYTFPNNIELFSMSSLTDEFMRINDQIKESGINFISNIHYSLNSRLFDSTKIQMNTMFSRPQSNRFSIKGSVKRVFNFEIDYFIDNYISFKNNGIFFTDPYYRKIRLTKEDILNNMICDCVNIPRELPHVCLCSDLKTCTRFHARKCRCGKFTYYRTDTCIKCHLTYTKSKKIKHRLESKRNDYGDIGLFTSHNIASYIPYLHYNQSSSGLCLGNGGEIINQMIDKNVNPLRLMLSFKVNLAYSDSEESNRYYMKYINKVTLNDIKKYEEYFHTLESVYRNQNISVKEHTFTLHCFCKQCLFLRIVMYVNNKLLHKELFEFNKSYIVSRDKFIELYKRYITRTTSRTYTSSYIHKFIKQIINTQPNDFYVTA